MLVREDEVLEESSNTPMAIRLDMLQDIIEDLNANTKLQKLFGNTVIESLMMVADNFDLRIEYAGDTALTDKESELLVSILEETIKANIRE
jgi:glycine betaine/choline ABC-type transport system substrate-binding protein